MTIEEKLQHFYDTSVGSPDEAENTLEAHKKTLEEMVEKHKEYQEKCRQAPARAETETQSARSTRHFLLSSFTSRRDWTARQTDA